jgi:hypothetical protein
VPGVEGVAENESDVAEEDVGVIVPAFPVAVFVYLMIAPEKLLPEMVKVVDCPAVTLEGLREEMVGAGVVTEVCGATVRFTY